MTAYYKGISLFTGCGGMDLGFSQEGFSFDYGMEADPKAVETYNANNRSKVRLTKITAATKIESDLDIIVAGPPCQGFSTAGGYKNSDPRNELLAITCSITTKAKPKVIVIENVSGLTNKVNSDTLARAVNILRQANYFVDMRIVECEKHGVPQRRRRLFIVARSEGREFSLADIPQKPRVLIKDVLSNSLVSDNPDIDKSIALVQNSKEWHIATAIKQGQKLCNVRSSEQCVHTWSIPKAFGRTNIKERELLCLIQKVRRQVRRRSNGDADAVELSVLRSRSKTSIEQPMETLLRKGYLRWVEGNIDLTNTFNGKYRRLVWEGISPTVDTRFGDFRLFLHPLENRGLSIREAARIQGFPDTFSFPQSKKFAFKQIGNAVPPPVAKSLASKVRGLI